jgi:hypothetical protein
LITVAGDHNTQRPAWLFDSTTIFLSHCLQIESSWSNDVEGMNLALPPWFLPGRKKAGIAMRVPQMPQRQQQNDSSSNSGNVNMRNGETQLSREEQNAIQGNIMGMLGGGSNGNKSKGVTAAKEKKSSRQLDVNLPPSPPPSK